MCTRNHRRTSAIENIKILSKEVLLKDGFTATRTTNQENSSRIGSGPAGSCSQQLTELDIRYRFERDNAIGGLRYGI
jgi:hypothetical protein